MKNHKFRTIRTLFKKSKPAPNGCIEWTGLKSRLYGKISFNGSLRRVHRVSYTLFVGPIGNKCVLHRCDNPPCFNPEHLFLGTMKDNTLDARTKGRHFHKIKNRHIKRIIDLRNKGLFQREIALTLGVSQAVISRILDARGMSHIKYLGCRRKITDRQIHKIIKLKNDGLTNSQISRLIGVTKTSINTLHERDYFKRLFPTTTKE